MARLNCGDSERASVWQHSWITSSLVGVKGAGGPLGRVAVRQQFLSHSVWDCSWHSGGEFLATSSLDHTTKIWDATRWEEGVAFWTDVV